MHRLNSRQNKGPIGGFLAQERFMIFKDLFGLHMERVKCGQALQGQVPGDKGLPKEPSSSAGCCL